MTTTEATPTFFKAGGTLDAEDQSYVSRAADDELLRHILAGQFCYILTARQMGKSSLVMRTVSRLRDEGICTAYVDLSAIGQPQREQWYLGILSRLADQLQLSVDAKEWWKAHGTLGAVQRFTNFLREVVLVERQERLVLFIDEIDSTLQLDFTDDFFAAIRSTYNQRAANAAYKRLSFVLLGVASPSDLIKDATRTPFNIGQPIDLCEFDRTDAHSLQEGLEQQFPGHGAVLLERFFFWTHGHPYLTQKLCYELVNTSDAAGTHDEIGTLVARLFFTSDARNEDINLKAVRCLIEQHPERRQLLHLYMRVYCDETITDDERSPYQNRLKLIGLVRSEHQRLVVRNEIYRRVFDEPWIKRNTPNTWQRMSLWQRVTAVAMTVSLILFIGLLLISAQQTAASIHTRMDIHAGLFERSSDPAVQMNSLYELCRIEHERASNRVYYMFVEWFEPVDGPLNRIHVAQHLFYGQPHADRLHMYHDLTISTYGDKLAVVVDCLYPPAPTIHVTDDESAEVGNAMCCALGQANYQKREYFERINGYTCTCKRHNDDSSD